MYDELSLEAHRRELTAAEIFNETLIDRLPLGLVVLDRLGFVVKYNRYEEELARRRRQDVIGRSFFEDVARCTNHPAVAGAYHAAMADDGELRAEVETCFDLPFHPKPRDVRILMQSFELGNQPFGVFLIEDITLRKELERERQRLLAMLVHDLKNPLQGILGYAGLLQVGAFGDIDRKDQREALAAIEASSLRMNELLSSTLDEMSGRKPRKNLVNLHALVLSAIGNSLPESRRRGLRLTYRGDLFERAEFPNEAFPVLGVVDQLARVIDNLLGNALKYGHSQLELDLETAAGFHCFTVRDDGRGIAPEYQDRVFAPGFQAPGSLPGHGLGLASAKNIAEEHGGRLELESTAGAGATFRLFLPVASV